VVANNGAPPLNATPVVEPPPEGGVVHGREVLEKRAGVLIRIWMHRTRPLAGTAATGQSDRELGAGSDQPDS